MKKLLYTILLTGLALTPSISNAQQTVPQGGTGLTSVPAGYVLMGSTSTSLRLTAVSSTTFSGGGSSPVLNTNPFQATYITATGTPTSTLPQLSSTNFFTSIISLGAQAISYIQSLFTGGTGISISGGTITNTGVTSIIAGTNVSISNATGTVTINSTGGGSSPVLNTRPFTASSFSATSTDANNFSGTLNAASSTGTSVIANNFQVNGQVTADFTINNNNNVKGSNGTFVLGDFYGLGLGSSQVIRWRNTASFFSGTDDIGLSRLGAGILGVGNGTQGDFSARIVANCFATSTAGGCITGGGGGGSGSGTVNSGTAGQAAFYASSGTAVSGTSTLFFSNGLIGISTSTPRAQLHVVSASTTLTTLAVQSVASQIAKAFDVWNPGSNSLFSVDPTGEIDFNGLPGNAGQILQSNGASSSPTWINNTGGVWSRSGTTLSPTTITDSVGIQTGTALAPLDVGGQATAIPFSITPQVDISANMANTAGVVMVNTNSTSTSADFRFAITDAASTTGNYLAVTMPGQGNTGVLFGQTRSGIEGMFSSGSNTGNGRILVLGTVNNNDTLIGAHNIEVLRATATGYITYSGTKPSIGSCGTGASVATTSNNISGTILMGTGIVSSCPVTFATPFTAGTNNIHVFLNDDSGTIAAIQAQSISNTGFTIAGTIAASEVVSYFVTTTK